MNRMNVVGTVLTVAGVGGFILGVVTPYPGRSVSLVSVLVGITFISIGVMHPLDPLEPREETER